MESDGWISERRRKEIEERNRLETFDKFVDLALDGVITMDEAITGFVEEWGDTYSKTASEEAA